MTARCTTKLITVAVPRAITNDAAEMSQVSEDQRCSSARIDPHLTAKVTR